MSELTKLIKILRFIFSSSLKAVSGQVQSKTFLTNLYMKYLYSRSTLPNYEFKDGVEGYVSIENDFFHLDYQKRFSLISMKEKGVLAYFINELNPKSFLEFGIYKGESLKILESNKFQGIYFGIDLSVKADELPKTSFEQNVFVEDTNDFDISVI